MFGGYLRFGYSQVSIINGLGSAMGIMGITYNIIPTLPTSPTNGQFYHDSGYYGHWADRGLIIL